MTTITNFTAQWAPASATRKNNVNLWKKWLAIADGQAKNQTLWFVVSLIVMGVFFLPLPAVLIYNYNAPIVVLVISMVLFFANFIAGMGGSGIRTTLLLAVITMVTYLTMAAIYIL